MITYKQDEDLELNDVLKLYNDTGWYAYTNNPEKLMRAIKNSMITLTAWKGNKLVGLIRAVGDQETILYIQDLLILSDCQRQGIGKTLLLTLLSLYPDVRQTVLITDNNPKLIAFYKSIPMKLIEDAQGKCFVKYRKEI
ncbi:GNAT family N-acetyltransferase [Erysipelothrix amsterdamensis]|uniref:GNAT family N-acetyltransferase n=1 Tax=Erysipelothrix amsterdamensis TaxID=2929157 RepID=A0AAU9VF71_9FIRM|nr:GNAT family N-acetyltransferase [Erysipelothrix sp. A18Y020d]CAH2763856.1 GNAT family N-acetyltransferase [Erysipelothrix sp. A18Y020d]